MALWGQDLAARAALGRPLVWEGTNGFETRPTAGLTADKQGQHKVYEEYLGDEGPELESGNYDDGAFEDGYEFEEYAPKDSKEDSSARGGGLFSFLGSIVSLAGLALASAPHAGGLLDEVAQQANQAGVSSVGLVITGLMLIGLSITRAEIRKLSSKPARLPNDLQIALTQMADQVGLLTGTLVHLQDEVTHLATREPIVQVEAPAPDKDLVALNREQKDATYRLAASLDKLGKNIDDQVAKRFSVVVRSVDTLREQLNSTRESIEEGLQETRSISTLMSTETPSANGHNGHQAAQPTAAPQAAAPQAAAPQAAAPQASATQAATPRTGEFRIEEPAPVQSTKDSASAFIEALSVMGPPSQSPRHPDAEVPSLNFDQLEPSQEEVQERLNTNKLNIPVDQPAAALPAQRDHITDPDSLDPRRIEAVLSGELLPPRDDTQPPQ